MNRQIVLAKKPTGIPRAADFKMIEKPEPVAPENGIVVRNHFLSVEPAMRGWLADKANYSKPINVGDVMRSLATGQVIASKNKKFEVGAFVTGWFGWQELAAVGEESIIRPVRETGLPLSLSLGVLGLNGMAAYIGLTMIGAPKAGETVVVSTAAGAVGSIVGQIANLHGCRTIAITGSAEKVELCLDRYGFESAIDYTDGNIHNKIAEACPRGIDIYFDNTGGLISDAIRSNLAVGARIIICGTASISSWDPPPNGPRVERDLLTKRARMEGFLAFDHIDKYASTVQTLAQLIREGKLTYSEDILPGLESCPDAIAGLYRGENLGKRLIKLI